MRWIQTRFFGAHRLPLLFAVLCGWSAPSQAGILPGALVSAAWLHDHLSSVQIVDVREDTDSLSTPPVWTTAQGHKPVLRQVGGFIAGARSLDFWSLRGTRTFDGHPLGFVFPDAARFTRLMQQADVHANRPIVITPTGDDAASLQEAAYLALELRVYGVPQDQVAILNGGLHAWIQAGYPVTVDTIMPMRSSHFTARPVHTDWIVHTAAVEAAQQAGTQLLDARPLSEYVGVEKSPIIPRLGRLAGARALPAEALYFRASDGAWYFMNAANNARVLAVLQLQPAANAIVYCNTGQYAAGAWFILHEILGMTGVREYPGSLYAWLAHGLPVTGLDPD
ncbi:sulfurtransferase [Halothiobacillus sp. DCM-1]|uniref:sulfurtransferase n=1 Tax=Halothiobacillus sp. DCM-1 TaxID=3112558 RepID=UPI0032550D09